MKNIFDFYKFKKKNKKISMVTAYDYTMAKIVNASDIDCILVGDSLAMVIHGHDSTLQANTDMMALHTEAVKRGAPDKPIITDMPFLSFRKGIKHAMDSVENIMRAGAIAVKLEGVTGHENVIEHIVNSDIPVMGHIGLTPQSIHKLGGYKIQGKTEEAAESLLQQAKTLEELGCFSIVLECIPSTVAQKISGVLSIPTIGIGAGPFTDGQVLVLQDLLGMYKDIAPKFVKHYMNGFDQILNSLNDFNDEIKNLEFPSHFKGEISGVFHA